MSNAVDKYEETIETFLGGLTDDDVWDILMDHVSIESANGDMRRGTMRIRNLSADDLSGVVEFGGIRPLIVAAIEGTRNRWNDALGGKTLTQAKRKARILKLQVATANGTLGAAAAVDPIARRLFEKMALADMGVEKPTAREVTTYLAEWIADPKRANAVAVMVAEERMADIKRAERLATLTADIEVVDPEVE